MNIDSSLSVDGKESPEAVSRDVAAVGRISAIPTILKMLSSATGMGFTAVARVTDASWTACAVQDSIGFGLLPGGQLEVRTTLCYESRAAREVICFDNASLDPVYRDHHTPRLYKIESYISVPIVRPDGSYFGNLCAIDPQPRTVSDPKTVAMFETFAELIGRQLDSEDKQQATETALLDERATAELREQFIAVLGHDLRSPLAAVSALGDLLVLRGPSTADENAQTGERIRQSTKRMAGLIDDVLDFARGRMGSSLGVAIRHVDDLGSALAVVVAESRSSNPGRPIDATIEVAGSVWCDVGRLQQLLSNLLGNALEHGAVDPPVSVQVAGDPQWLQIDVTNQGAPVSAANLERIFEPYWRPKENDARGGLGLGLHISSLIVKAHAGSLEVISTAEGGTRFSARIPTRPGISAVA